jgi:hypothetical protein
VREIPLNGKAHGRTAYVDDADYELVSQHNWYIVERVNEQTAYAQTNVGNTTLLMHTLITGYARTDHDDRNGLNNQRYNLRDASRAENAANRLANRNSTSHYLGVHWYEIGVHWYETRHKWQAQIAKRVDGKRIRYHLGYFNNEEAAARARDRKAKELFGEFALLNFRDE